MIVNIIVTRFVKEIDPLTFISISFVMEGLERDFVIILTMDLRDDILEWEESFFLLDRKISERK